MKAKQKPGVLFQPHVHHTLQRGIYQMVSALRPTLGPMGGGVVIDHLNDTKPLPEFLEEGGVIARRIIELKNRDEDVGAMLVRAMLLRQHERSGDGTATAAVLFEAVFNAGVRYIASGGNAMLLRRHLEQAIPRVLDTLDAMSFTLEGQDAIARMARSMCHDEDMASLMGECFDLLGEYGRLAIREGYGRGMVKEYVEGSHFYSGVLSRVMLPEDAEATLRMENPAIFLCDLTIEDHRTLFPVLRAANDAGVSGLVIIARGLSEKAISLLMAHNRMDKFQVVGVKLPGLNTDDRMAAIEDLSLMTGATPVLEVTGGNLEPVTENDFGSVRRFWVSTYNFGFVGGQGNPRRLREHLTRLKTRCRNAKEVETRKELRDRIGAMLGGSLTMWIGGFSEPEIAARKALAERTALALRSALDEGAVPGGGSALLNCRTVLEQHIPQTTDAEERAAYRLLAEALAAPARTIFRNAGYDPGEVLGRLSLVDGEVAFNVITNQVEDVRQTGLVDSLPVLKACVRNAVSTSALALTIDSVVHLSKPEMIGEPE